MMIQLSLLGVSTPHLATLAEAMQRVGQPISVAINGTVLQNYLDSLDDATMVLESVIVHLLAIGDNSSLLTAAIKLDCPITLMSQTVGVITISLHKAKSYLIVNTVSSNSNKLVLELYRVLKGLNVFDNVTAWSSPAGLKLGTL